MATVAFTPNLERHVECPTREAGNVFASTDRGQTWSVVSNHLPPVHAVTFTG